MTSSLATFGLAVLLLFAAIAESDAAGVSEVAPAETAVDSSDAPKRVRYRGTLEDAFAVPGTILYLPIAAFFDLSKVAANAVWNQHLLDRAKAWMTTADGRRRRRHIFLFDLELDAIQQDDCVVDNDTGQGDPTDHDSNIEYG